MLRHAVYPFLCRELRRDCNAMIRRPIGPVTNFWAWLRGLFSVVDFRFTGGAGGGCGVLLDALTRLIGNLQAVALAGVAPVACG